MQRRAAPARRGGALAGRDFRLLALGQGLSWIGNAFQPVALAVAIIAVGGSVSELGVVMAVGVIGRLACTLFGGVWADRLAPQRLMIGSDLVRAITTAAMAVMFGTGHRSLPLLCVFVAISAGAGAFFYPAMSSLKPILVPAGQRQSANATLSMLQTATSVAGPATAGVLVGFAGPAAGFWVNTATYVASAITVILIRARTTRGRRAGFLRELSQGWRAVRTRDWLLAGLIAAGVYHIANGVVLVLVQVVAIRDLGGSASLGFIAAAEGAGGFVGGLVALRLRPGRLLLAGFLALGLMPIWVISYVWPGRLSAVLAGAAIGYAGLMFFTVCWETALQDNIPHELLARVASWDILTSFVGMPLGNAVAGPLASSYGIAKVLMGCAVILLIAGLSPVAVRGARSLRSREIRPG